MTVKNKLELCLLNDDLSDCEFIVGKQKCRIKGHKLLFGISSPVFRAMLYDDSKIATTFQIEDVEADQFNGMKQFFYTDNVSFTSSLHACSVYLASWKYVIPDLMTTCVQYIKDNISVTEVIEVYEFSHHNNIPDIETICCAVFQDKTKEIMESEKFISADIHTLEKILKLDSLKLTSELEVFKYAEKWVLAQAGRRNIDKQQLGEHFNSITRQIRFLTMSKEQYQEGPYKSDLLTAEEKLSITHNLLGLEDQLPLKFSAERENRVFKKDDEEEEEEEEEEERKEEDNEQGDNRNNKNKDRIVHNQMQDENTQQSVDKILRIPSNAENFKFIFSHTNRRHHFKYQGLDFEIFADITTNIAEVQNKQVIWITLINKHNIKLSSVEKVKIIWMTSQRFENTIFENVSTIENDEHIFPYLVSGDPPATGVKVVHFELTLTKL